MSGFDKARAAKKSATSRRHAIREGANLAQAVRNALMQAYLNKVEEGVMNPLEIPREVLEATKQTSDAFEVEFQSDDKKARRNRPGSPVDADALIRNLEGN